MNLVGSWGAFREGLGVGLFLHLFVLHDVKHIRVQSLVLSLLRERCAVGVDVLRRLHTFVSSCTQLSEALLPVLLVGSKLDFLAWIAITSVVRIEDHILVVGHGLAHVVHHAVFLCQLSADGFDRVDKSDFSHMCSAIERGVEIFKDN